MRLVPNSDLWAASSSDGRSKVPAGGCPLRNVTSHPRHPVVAELEVADAATVVTAGVRTATVAGDDLGGDHRRLAFGEHAGLRRPDARHVADRVHAGEAVSSVSGSTGIHPSTHIPDSCDDRGRPVHRHAEEQVVRQLAAVGEHDHLARRVERPDELPRMPVDAALGEGGEQLLPTRPATAGSAPAAA